MEDKALSTAAANGIFETKEEAEKAAEAIAKEHIENLQEDYKDEGCVGDLVLVQNDGWDVYEDNYLVSRYEVGEIHPHDL
jgi:hypothetical protein